MLPMVVQRGGMPVLTTFPSKEDIFAFPILVWEYLFYGECKLASRLLISCTTQGGRVD